MLPYVGVDVSRLSFVKTKRGQIVKLFIRLLPICILVAGCAAGSNFKPTSKEGTDCKAQCEKDMAMCQGSSSTCDRAAASCMSACEEVDAIANKGKK